MLHQQSFQLQVLIPTLSSPPELPSAHISESLDGFHRVNQVALQLFITGLDLSFLRTEKPVTACFPAFQLPTFYCHFLLFGCVLEKSHQYCFSGVSEETGATYFSSIAIFNQIVPNYLSIEGSHPVLIDIFCLVPRFDVLKLWCNQPESFLVTLVSEYQIHKSLGLSCLFQALFPRK